MQLIKIGKYATQIGQLRSMGRDQFGDAAQTLVTTIACLVYQDADAQAAGTPTDTGTARYIAVVPSSVAVRMHDHLSEVVDKSGNPIISDSRVVRVTEYNHWRFGPEFKQLELSVDLDD